MINHNSVLRWIIFIYCLSLPLYFIRLPIYGTTFGISSLIALIVILFLFDKNIFRELFLKKRVFAVITLLFTAPFLSSLFLYYSHHALGVIIEWICIPTLLCLVLLHSSYAVQNIRLYIYQGLILSLSFVLTATIVFIFFELFTYDGRLSGFFSSPNYLAMYIAPLILLLLPKTHSNDHFEKITVTTLFIISIIIIFQTQSYTTSAILFFLSLIYFVIKFSGNYLKIILLTLAFLLLLTSSTLIKIHNSNFLQANNSFTSRLAIWDSAIYLIQKSPLYGYTIDHFQQEYLAVQKHFEPYPEWAVPTPHNLYMTFLLSGGGFFTLLLFFLLIARIIYETPCEKDSLIYYLIILLFLLTGLTDTPLWKNDLFHLFWLIVFLIITSTENSAHNPSLPSM